MMLDRLYFKNLWSAAQKYISKSQKEAFKKFIGTQIDLSLIHILSYQGLEYKFTVSVPQAVISNPEIGEFDAEGVVNIRQKIENFNEEQPIQAVSYTHLL